MEFFLGDCFLLVHTVYIYIFATFPGEPGLAGFIGAKDDGSDGDNWSCNDMQSYSQIITTNKPTSSFLQAGCPSCRPTNSVKALKGKYHIPWTCSPQAHVGIFRPCL